MDRGDSFHTDGKESLVIVNPLSAGQLDVSSYVRVVAGWPLHHHWQAVFPCLQAAVTEHWQPLWRQVFRVAYNDNTHYLDVCLLDKGAKLEN